MKIRYEVSGVRGDAHPARPRAVLRAGMGAAGVVTPAAGASCLRRMVRIADAIGIEPGDCMEFCTEEVRSDPALDRLWHRPQDLHGHESVPAAA